MFLLCAKINVFMLSVGNICQVMLIHVYMSFDIGKSINNLLQRHYLLLLNFERHSFLISKGYVLSLGLVFDWTHIALCMSLDLVLKLIFIFISVHIAILFFFGYFNLVILFEVNFLFWLNILHCISVSRSIFDFPSVQNLLSSPKFSFWYARWRPFWRTFLSLFLFC